METVNQIKRATCDHFGITAIEMASDRRSRRLSRPRQVAIMLAAEMTPLSLPAIGRLFNRDHSTVMHAIGIMKVLCERDSAFSDEVEAVRKRVALEPA